MDFYIPIPFHSHSQVGVFILVPIFMGFQFAVGILFPWSSLVYSHGWTEVDIPTPLSPHGISESTRIQQ